MQWEVEQKFPLNDAPAVRTKLLELGARFESPIEQVDRYFNHPSRDFAQTDEAFRLRQVADKNFITYKGPKLDPTTKTRREIELPLPPGRLIPGKFTELFAALGFQLVGTVSKCREPGTLDWEGQNVHVAID